MKNTNTQLVGGEMLSFEEVFGIWMDNEAVEVPGRNLLKVAQEKGFGTVRDWRMATALRLGMDAKEWRLFTVTDPNGFLPNVLMGPYQGWQQFMPQKLTASFADALNVKAFYEWCQTHDRVKHLAQNFPVPSTVILFKLPNGRFMQVEGGHRMCAVAYRVHKGQPIQFPENTVRAAVADITDGEFQQLFVFLRQGTDKQKTP